MVASSESYPPSPELARPPRLNDPLLSSAARDNATKHARAVAHFLFRRWTFRRKHAHLREALCMMGSAEAAAQNIADESRALRDLASQAEVWLQASRRLSQFGRSPVAHESADRAHLNDQIVARAREIIGLTEAEVARRDELERLVALHSGALTKTRGAPPAVQWFVAYAAVECLDDVDAMMIEALAVLHGVFLRRGMTWWTSGDVALEAWRKNFDDVVPGFPSRAHDR